MGTLADHESAALSGTGSLADREIAFWAAMAAGGGSIYRNESFATAGTDAHSTRVTGDANPRFTQNADGSLEWGPGNAALDTILYRAGVGLLRTDGILGSKRALATDESFRTLVGAEAFNRWILAADGKMLWGPGTGVGDTNLYRSGIGFIKSDHNIVSAVNIVARQSGSAETKIGAYGPSSEAGILLGSAGDTNLYRSAANELKTDDSFVVTESLIATKALIFSNGSTAGGGYLEGREQSADPAAPVVDRGRLFFKDNGSGKTQLCVIFNTGAVQVLATQP